MPTRLPANPQPRFHVLHYINTAGTTWLRESDLVFVDKRPYAVLSWSRSKEGDVPEVVIELDSEMLKHDRPDDPVYRYEGEVQDPRTI
jgi:hypothetical protein